MVKNIDINNPADTPYAKKDELLKKNFADFDTNKDGKVSKKEWLDYVGNIFDKAYNEVMAEQGYPPAGQ